MSIGENCCAGEFPLNRAASRDHVECLKRMHDDGFDMDEQKYSGYTALMVASSEGNVRSIEYLCKVGSNLNLQNDCGHTAMMEAVSCAYSDELSDGRLSCLKILCEHGGNINVQNEEGETVLMMCVDTVCRNYKFYETPGRPSGMKPSYERYLECIQYLCDMGADIELKNIDGLDAMTIAKDGGHPKCVEILEAAGYLGPKSAYKK